MWRWTRIEEGQEKLEEMLNLFCYVIHYTLCETLNTRLDKLANDCNAGKTFLLHFKINFIAKKCKTLCYGTD